MRQTNSSVEKSDEISGQSSLSLRLEAAHHAPHAEEHEGDAEELAHVERHAYLKVALYLLEELHEEAEGEDVGEAVAKEEACAYLARHALVEVPADETEHGIRDGLVELCRVAGEHVDLGEDEAEVASRGAAYNLGVHEVAQADAASGDRGGNGDVVEHGPQGYLILAHIEPQGYHQAECTAMACQALIADEAHTRGGEAYGEPHLDEAGEVVEVVLGLVEDAVAQTGTEQDAEEAVEEEGLEELGLYLLILVELLHYEIAACQAQHPKQGVEAQGTNANGGIPGNHE